MARIPDIDSLGARPTPRFQRSVTSVRNAGAVADAAGQFGETMTRVAGQAIEKEDRLSYAAAKAAMLKADIAARQELESDPDYETWETRYTERMTTASAAAGQMIRSNSDRALFETEIKVDLARGGAAVSSAVTSRRRDARVAMLDEGLTSMEDVGQSAPDDATREAALANAAELIQGAVERGDITAVDGISRRQGFAQSHTVGRIETMLLADDYDGAAALLERSRGRLDPAAETNLRRQIDSGLDNRNAITRAEEAVHGAGPATAQEGGPATAAPDLIRGFEGFREATYWDVNHHRTGYGSDTITTADGRVREVRQGDRVSRADAERDLARRVSEIEGVAARKGGEGWESLPASAQAAVVSVAYNYGAGHERLRPLWNAVAKGDGDEVASVIESFAGDNNGANRNRRTQEAQAARGGTTQGAKRHDLGNVLDAIDVRAAAEGWTPEETEAAKTQATRIVQRDESLLQRQYSDAGDEAAQAIAALPGGLTNINQIPKRIRDQMDPTAVAELEQGIRERAQEKAEDAREDAQARRATELAFMERFEPDRFKRLNPLAEASRLGPQQYNAFMMDYLEANEDKPFDPSGVRGGINEEINFQLRHGGLEFDDPEKVALFDYMEAQLGLVRQTKGKLDNSDYSAAFHAAMRTIPNTSTGWFGTGDDRRAFEVFNVPAEAEAEIVRNWRGPAPPTPGQVKAVYARMLREGD